MDAWSKNTFGITEMAHSLDAKEQQAMKALLEM
jgi:hypothetical protein